MKPTTEQQEIVKAAKENKMLKVNACAGSGKSSTLALIANSDFSSSIYLAFNKAMADEAKEKFPDHVACKTTHSVAFGKEGRKIKHKLNRPKGRYVNVAGTPAEVVKFYNITGIEFEGENKAEITAKAIAVLIKKTVSNFESSAEFEIERNHVPFRDIKELEEKHEELDKNELIDKVVRYAKILWKDRIDTHSPVLATHDTYLKMYQLSNPTLNYDVIYLDEAQDTTDCVLDILLKQTAKLILVGDSRQAIYGWRGAVNAMQKVECAEKNLTQSFRYGQKVADIATIIINGEMQIKGNPDIESEVGGIDENEQYTMLFRTNGALLMKAVNLIQEGKNVKIEADTNDFVKMLYSAQALMMEEMKDVKHEKIVPYSDWDDMKDNAEDDPELKRLVKIVEGGQSSLFVGCLKNTTQNEEDADVILTTAHKSKGRQFEQMIVADDFQSLYNDDGGKREISEEELNLLYVASTRAVKTLEVNTLITELMDQYYDQQKETETE